MTENIGSEYQIPFGEQHPNFEQPQNSTSFRYENQVRPEKTIEMITENLISIGENIESARAKYLDSYFISGLNEKGGAIKSLARKLTFRGSNYPALTESDLKNREAEICSRIFGEPKPGEHIRFFNDDPTNWYFYKEVAGSKDLITLRYEIHKDGIDRTSNASAAAGQRIEGEEFRRVVTAMEMSGELISNFYQSN